MIRTKKVFNGRKRFGQIMGQMRKNAGLSQPDLRDKVKLKEVRTVQYISNLERGVGGNWPIEVIRFLFRANDLPVDAAIDLIRRVNVIRYAYEFDQIDYDGVNELLKKIPVPTKAILK